MEKVNYEYEIEIFKEKLCEGRYFEALNVMQELISKYGADTIRQKIGNVMFDLDDFISGMLCCACCDDISDNLGKYCSECCMCFGGMGICYLISLIPCCNFFGEGGVYCCCGIPRTICCENCAPNACQCCADGCCDWCC